MRNPCKKIAFKKLTFFLFLAAQIIFSSSCSAAETSLNEDQRSSDKMECKTPLDKSAAMIEFVLTDLKSTYTEVGGGGITEIKQSFTNTFVVSIAQEERIDQLTYELSIDKDCNIKILDKKSSTITF